MQKLALALTLVSLSIAGCKPSVDQPPIDAPVQAEPDAAPPVAREPVESVESVPIVYFVGSQLWRVDTGGGDPRPLGYEVSPENPGMDEAIGEGDSTPTVSRDGRWLAWVDTVDLWLTEFTPGGPVEHQVTKMPPRKDDWIIAASISFSTWSPDSSTLVVNLREPGYAEEDPLPLPAGAQYGFHTLRPGERKLVHAPHIAGVYGWTPDSEAVIDNKYNSAGDYDLLAYPIEPGPAKQLRHSSDDYGFSQMHVEGGWVAWNTSQIFVAPIAGGEPKPMSPTAGFADIQWPTVAPDGAHVTFELKGRLQLAAGPSEVEPLSEVRQMQWFDAEHLLAITDAGLVLLDLDGNAKLLDPAATLLVRR